MYATTKKPLIDIYIVQLYFVKPQQIYLNEEFDVQCSTSDPSSVIRFTSIHTYPGHSIQLEPILLFQLLCLCWPFIISILQLFYYYLLCVKCSDNYTKNLWHSQTFRSVRNNTYALFNTNKVKNKIH